MIIYYSIDINISIVILKEPYLHKILSKKNTYNFLNLYNFIYKNNDDPFIIHIFNILNNDDNDQVYNLEIIHQNQFYEYIFYKHY